MRDVPKEPREDELIEKEKTGTLTLRRKDKMQTLKKKLKTDDDLNWVRPELRSSGVDFLIPLGNPLRGLRHSPLP